MPVSRQSVTFCGLLRNAKRLDYSSIAALNGIDIRLWSQEDCFKYAKYIQLGKLVFLAWSPDFGSDTGQEGGYQVATVK